MVYIFLISVFFRSEYLSQRRERIYHSLTRITLAARRGCTSYTATATATRAATTEASRLSYSSVLVAAALIYRAIVVLSCCALAVVAAALRITILRRGVTIAVIVACRTLRIALATVVVHVYARTAYAVYSRRCRTRIRGSRPLVIVLLAEVLVRRRRSVVRRCTIVVVISTVRAVVMRAVVVWRARAGARAIARIVGVVWRIIGVISRPPIPAEIERAVTHIPIPVVPRVVRITPPRVVEGAYVVAPAIYPR